MVTQEVLKCPEQFGSMFYSTVLESPADVVNDHRPDGFAAVRLPEQIAGQCGRSNFGDVLMLADCGNFILVETAKIDAVLQRNHGSMLLLSLENVIHRS